MWFNFLSRRVILLLSFVLSFGLNRSTAQISWSKYPGNPVLKRGDTGEFDAAQAKQPTVIIDHGIFKMWYIGKDNSLEQIGYAESEDGIIWIKKGPVLPLGGPGEFDCIHQNTPKVLKIGTEYHLWYSGFDGSYWRIGKAFSTDGFNWQKEGVVLEKGNPGDFDAIFVSAPMVLCLNSNYFLWFEGFDGNSWRIGFATSADGLNWQKQGLALDLGTNNEFDWAGHAHPEVLFCDGLFHLWYSGFDGISWRIGYATSSIGKAWQKYGVALNVSAPGLFDSGDVADCSVIFDGNQYRMWYSGDVYRDWQIGYAVEDKTWENLFIDVSQDTRVLGPWEAGSAFGDFNNDGFQDLYLGYRYDQNALLINNKGQAFSNLAASAGVDFNGWTHGVSCADFNNDGYLDIYLSNHNVPNILYKNTGDLIFKNIATKAGVGTDLNSYHAVWGDYNNDGLVDLYVINFELEQANILYRNNGDETFTDITTIAGVDGRPEQKSRSACWGDYNNDGLLDLFVINQGEDVLYINNGNGTFDDVTASAGIYDTGNGHSCAWGDANNDGFLDLFLTNRYRGCALFMNLRDGIFEDATSVSGLDQVIDASTCSWGDFDSDGDLDLYAGNGWGGRQFLLSNDGQGHFTDVIIASGLTNYRSVNSSVGDYNNDGAVDLFLTGSRDGEFQAHLYRNKGNSNHWITLNLIGSISNRSAIGARVRLIAGRLSQIREVTGGYGLFSFDSLPLEFGLGSATKIDSLIIHWPSGVIQILSNLEVDQILTIQELPSTVKEDKRLILPEDFYLSQIFPNPFNGLINIEYHIPEISDVALHIYDLLGRHIKTLVTDKHQPGIHLITWDVSDDLGNQVTSGIYFVRMSAVNFEQIRKIVYLK